MLLPLPASTVKQISLENHMSLVLMRNGHGTADTMTALLRILYMTFYLLEGSCSEADLALFLEVEMGLDKSIREASRGRDWQVDAQWLPAIGQVLRRNDEIVGSVPRFRYTEAWERLRRFVISAQISPLPGSPLNEVQV
ncbi:MAG: hypothetical protein RXR52_32405 [Paraburkholderia sp.]|nr:hypothetical protein [Burkholderia sp. 4M9327F10]